MNHNFFKVWMANGWMVGRVNPKKRFLLFLKLWSYEVIICITKNRNVIAISVDKPPFALKFATIGLLLMVSYKCTYDFDIKKKIWFYYNLSHFKIMWNIFVVSILVLKTFLWFKNGFEFEICASKSKLVAGFFITRSNTLRKISMYKKSLRGT